MPSVGWHDRNLFGNAEQLNITGGAQLGGDAVTQPGYNFGIQFIKPDFLARDQSLEADLDAVKQSLQAYDQRALMQKIVLNRKLFGALGDQLWPERRAGGHHAGTCRREFQSGRNSAVREVRQHGRPAQPDAWLSGRVAADADRSLGGKNATFVITQLTASAYFDLSGNGRTVLATRGLVGKAFGASQFELPPDQRFYAGGSGTVRGYRYQSVGPQFPDGNPEGGTGISAGTIELRQRFLQSFGAVAFVDAGQVSPNGAPFTSNWHIGAGVGARYYTSVGPIRLDVAVPLNREPHGDAFELYIGIGQAF